jgi:hypothetical protein
MAAMPPAARMGPPAASGPQQPSAPLLTFTDRYRDVRYDLEDGTYGHLLTHFDPISTHSLSAAKLLDSVLQEADENSRAIAVH